MTELAATRWDAPLACFSLFGERACVRPSVAEWEPCVRARRRSSMFCLSQQREPAATAAAYITISDVAPQTTPPRPETDTYVRRGFISRLCCETRHNRLLIMQE